MKGADLKAELDAHVSAVRQFHLDPIRALGVHPAAIAAIGAHHPPFGVVEAETTDDGYYVPGAGALHVVMPVYDGGLVDLVAWRLDDPARWYLRTGLGWLLNADECLRSRWDGETVTLYSSPLAWLRAGSSTLSNVGGVVLDWDSPDLCTLRSFETVNCSDDQVAAMLHQHFAKPDRIPRITTMEARCAA